MDGWLTDANLIVDFLFTQLAAFWQLITGNWILMLSFSLFIISLVVTILKRIMAINNKSK